MEAVKESINVDAKILQALMKMPEPLKEEALNYIEYLLEKHSKTNLEVEKPKERRLVGCMKGTFVLPLPDDFDDPLEDFEEYM
ncbi:DUF2281 domain-containing protein [Spirulina sp. CCNP1310]|uniref:type II toxin-antitoxin system VapB family antitoxin n=1 Tax=Spirulina sp. CCNP1310 TaxID=3110249 RepID=UPI002B20DD07|nr:DUF2281 domain-containing protein [Spirulina sp. CCNP1310]MEA5420672.1 DUF2281 domain-containing protein [Spirulina sp. CCNP1310]